MDPMALLQYQFLMAKAAEYRAIAARQAMIANARLGGFPTFDPSSTTHLTNVDKVRIRQTRSGVRTFFGAQPHPSAPVAPPDDARPDSPPQVRLLQQMQAHQAQMLAAARPEASHARLVQQPEPAPRAGSFDDSTVARVLQDLREDSPTHSGDGARLDPDSEDDAAEACRAAREEQRGALAPDRDPARERPPHHRFQTRVPTRRKHHPRASLGCRFRFGGADVQTRGGKSLSSFRSSSPPGIEPREPPPDPSP